MKKYIIIVFVILSALFLSCSQTQFNTVLLRDDFSKLDTGLFSAPVGAHTEYHYLPEAGQRSNWVVSSFASGEGWGTAWQVRKDGQNNVMCQTYLNKNNRSTHPMIISGDSLWRDYQIRVIYSPEDIRQYSGIAFRYRNDRCFYFFGIKDSTAYISVFKHSDNFNTLNEKVLASEPFVIRKGENLTLTVRVKGSSIIAELNDDLKLKAEDLTYPAGKIGLVSNSRAQYKFVEVLTSPEENDYLINKRAAYQLESVKLQDANPKMILWKKIMTRGFGVGRNLRFGDMDGDKQPDVLIGQVIHHGPRDSHSELSCLTAMTFEGKLLWQIGKPDPGKNNLTNDVGFQIHDIDNDGKNEVISCMNFEIIVADASTGKTKYKAPTPVSKIKNDKFSQILGDCLFFFDPEGKGWDSDILIKDRYTNFWVLNNKIISSTC